MTTDTKQQNLQTYKPKFPEVVDNTIVSAFLSCPTKAYRQHFLGLQPPQKSIHLHAGGCFAKALEVARLQYYTLGATSLAALEQAHLAFIKEWGEVEAPERGTGANKTFERVWGAVEFYFEQYPFASDPIKPVELPDSQSSIEFSFGIPLPIDHPDTGDPIIYAGRFDLLGHYEKFIAIIDEKTTSALGASWPNQWGLKSQFIGYVWGAQRSGIETQTAVIRGVSILKTKYDTLQVIKHFPPHMVDRWRANMLRAVAHMKAYYEEAKTCADDNDLKAVDEVWPRNYGNSCTEYGGCIFTDLCTSPNPAIWYSDFDVRRWNPLERAADIS
ncbi:MAG: PD-(D/E)XK nuclease family protein [Nitrospinae bacterium]|nr:PD-(D/E)XK nuclease family protein [Nitrospinota bacterium]